MGRYGDAMQLVRRGAPAIAADNLGRPLVRFAIRSPTRPEVSLILDCPAADRSEALEIVMRNRTAGDAPLLLDEERLSNSLVSSAWQGSLLGKRLLAGYDRLRFLEFRRFWDFPIPPAWLDHVGQTGLGVSDPVTSEDAIHLWFLNSGLRLRKICDGERHPHIRSQIYDVVFSAFLRCKSELYLVSGRPSIFAAEADEAMVEAAIAERMAGWQGLAQLLDAVARLAGKTLDEGATGPAGE